MGMDVIGKNPTSETGTYFRNTDSWWTPLAEYVSKVAPEIASKCPCWHSNGGNGLSESYSRMLSDILQNELGSGRTEAYAQQRQVTEYVFSTQNVQRFATCCAPVAALRSGELVLE